MSRERHQRWWFRVAPAERLASLRALIGAFGVVYLLARVPALLAVGGYDPTRFRPVGPLVLLPTAPPAVAMLLVLAVTLVTGVAFTLGYRYRLSAPLYALGLLLTLSYRNAWGMVFHTENLLVVHTIALAASPASDAWALDARCGRTRGRSGEHYGWAIRLLQTTTVLAYFIAGWSKVQIAGWAWVASDNLRNHVAYDNLRKAELGAVYSWLGAAVVRQRWLFPPIAAVSLALELGAPLALLHRRIAWIWAFATWGFHLGVLVLMAIFFPYPLLGIAFAPFFPVERIVQRCGALVRRRRG